MKITRALFPLILGLTWTSLLACSERAAPPTSSDPGLAGRASNLVIGGGIDIQVKEGTVGRRGLSTFSLSFRVHTRLWSPDEAGVF